MTVKIFDISRISAMVALILSSAYIIVNKELGEGIVFFILGFAVLFLWWFMECCWIEHKHDRNIR
jgi:hypothetical protein